MSSAAQQRRAEPPPAPRRAIQIGKGFLAGCVASCGAVAVTNGMDVIRTRLELQGELARGGTQLYRGAVHGLMKMVEQEGPAVLFRGLKPAFAFQIAVNGTRLGTFIPLKKWLVGHSSMDDFLTSLLAGAGAGCVGAAIGTPFQLIKTRMQAAARAAGPSAVAGVARQPYKGLGDALASIIKSEGKQQWCSACGNKLNLKAMPCKEQAARQCKYNAKRCLNAAGLFGLYRGAHINMLKIAVASAVQLAVFDGLKARLLRPAVQGQQDQQPSGTAGSWLRAHPGAAVLLSAMAAGLAVTAVVQPVDVVTTRLWNQPVVNGVGTLYSTAWDCALKTVAAEGPMALYKGCTAHFLRAGPHTVLTLLLLDRMQKLLGLQPPGQQQQRRLAGGPKAGAAKATA